MDSESKRRKREKRRRNQMIQSLARYWKQVTRKFFQGVFEEYRAGNGHRKHCEKASEIVQRRLEMMDSSSSASSPKKVKKNTNPQGAQSNTTSTMEYKNTKSNAATRVIISDSSDNSELIRTKKSPVASTSAIDRHNVSISKQLKKQDKQRQKHKRIQNRRNAMKFVITDLEHGLSSEAMNSRPLVPYFNDEPTGEVVVIEDIPYYFDFDTEDQTNYRQLTRTQNDEAYGNDEIHSISNSTVDKLNPNEYVSCGEAPDIPPNYHNRESESFNDERRSIPMHRNGEAYSREYEDNEFSDSNDQRHSIPNRQNGENHSNEYEGDYQSDSNEQRHHIPHRQNGETHSCEYEGNEYSFSNDEVQYIQHPRDHPRGQ